MGIVNVVVGGQFGSEGKGHVTGWLSKSPHIRAVVRVAGPNAGHTAYDEHGNAWSLRQVPIAAVTNPDCHLYLAAGSEIDPRVLLDEVNRLEIGGIRVRDRLFVDPEATVIEAHHLESEQALVSRIGSTGKGIGAARAQRIQRLAMTWTQRIAANDNQELNTAPIEPAIRSLLANGDDIIIEGTQGYGLGLHAGYYPYCTSSDCRAIDFLAMAGVYPWNRDTSIEVWPVFRTYPIRVAGNSGPMSNETTWKNLGRLTNGYVKPEHTTVTQKVRRVGEWDPSLAGQAILANGWPSVQVNPVLTFVDYVFPELAGADRDQIDKHEGLWPYLQKIEAQLYGAQLAALATGPDTLVPLR